MADALLVAALSLVCPCDCACAPRRLTEGDFSVVLDRPLSTQTGCPVIEITGQLLVLVLYCFIFCCIPRYFHPISPLGAAGKEDGFLLSPSWGAKRHAFGARRAREWDDSYRPFGNPKLCGSNLLNLKERHLSLSNGRPLSVCCQRSGQF
jgi:hypothetical protein